MDRDGVVLSKSSAASRTLRGRALVRSCTKSSSIRAKPNILCRDSGLQRVKGVPITVANITLIRTPALCISAKSGWV